MGDVSNRILITVFLVWAIGGAPLEPAAAGSCNRDHSGIQAPKLPSDATVDFDPKIFVKQGGRSVRRPNDYFAQMRKLGDHILRNRGRDVRIETVFYPMTGLDGAMPFSMFPDAKLVIGLDEHPFLPDHHPLIQNPNQSQMLFNRAHGQNYTYTTSLDNVPTGTTVLETLVATIPGFRLREVAISHDHYLGFIGDKIPLTHGLIAFDTGPGTPVRRYVHLHQSIGEFEKQEFVGRWWRKYLKLNAPDVILLKGTNNALDYLRSDREEVANARATLKSWLKNTVKPLLLLEGTSSYSRANGLGELSGADPRFPTPVSSRRLTTTDLGVDYSYNKDVLIWDYGAAL